MRSFTALLIALFGCIIIGAGCKKTAKPLTVGSIYGGGIVVYILQPGDPGYSASAQHGLVAAPYDQKTGMQWGNYVPTGVADTTLGSGLTNTTAIISTCGPASAAYSCSIFTLDEGFTKWYLPSKNELNKLYLFKVSQPAIGGFANAPYWSSSEANSDSAWAQGFQNGGQGSLNKYDTLHVRAVRSF